jgi:sucrose-6-phosphate hydrolase SacC (GH32 family)
VLAGEETKSADEADIVIADFEGDTYGDWKTEGEAFGPAPAHGTLESQMPVSGFQGNGLVNSFFHGDKTNGTLTSPEFVIQRDVINMLVGGGYHPKMTCVNLLIDGVVARTTSGPEDEKLDWVTWGVKEYKGKAARIQIVDSCDSGWGHINVDQIYQSNDRKREEVMAEELYNESYRPQFHFTPQKNWTNDPNGLVYYAGEYHLFFQHNPFDINWGNMTWGHAVSKDLVHWEELKPALEPDEHGTCFSGSAVVDWNNTAGFQSDDEKTLVALYTGAPVPEVPGGPKFTQCLAYSNDRGRTWKKYDQNPVLPNIVGGNRDPKVIWHEPTKKWVMALYLDKNDYALFGSTDLKSWEKLCDVNVPNWSECPDFFEMPIDGNQNNTKWIFMAASGWYRIGTFDGKTFTPETEPIRGDYGGNFYAIQSYSDIPAEDGRRIQISWMAGGKYPNMPFNQQMSFPCQLSLHSDPEGLRIHRWPVREIESLRDKKTIIVDRALGPDETIESEVTGDLFDIEAEFETAGDAEFGFKIRGAEIWYSTKNSELVCIDKAAPMKPEQNRVKIRILVDRSSLEVFGNDGVISMTSCFLPKLAAHNLDIFTRGGKARLVSARINTLRSAWPQTK